jgi:hypothetical protein
MYKGKLPTDTWFPPWKQSALCSALLCAVCIAKLTTFMTHAEGTFLRRNLLFAFVIGNLVVGTVLATMKPAMYMSAALLFIEGAAFIADALRPREVKAGKAEKPATPRGPGRPAASPKPAAKKRPGSPTPAKQDKYSWIPNLALPTPAKPKAA